MQPFESSGFWYLPTNPSDHVAGTLRYTQEEGLRLSLTGSLSEPTGESKPQTYPLIFGAVQGNPYGDMITLARCWQTGQSISLPGFSSEEIHAGVSKAPLPRS
jgi:hypothetical protein